jgi:ribosomal protein S18 acetylase RimI-like enzyme
MAATIRPMTIDDYDQVLAMWLASEHVACRPESSDSKSSIQRFLARNPKMSFVAEDESGNILAACLGGHDGKHGMLSRLAVVPEARRQGLGRSVSEHCLKAIHDSGIERCLILVYAENTEGLAFWQRIGWETVESKIELLHRSTAVE